MASPVDRVTPPPAGGQIFQRDVMRRFGLIEGVLLAFILALLSWAVFGQSLYGLIGV